jgi:hypothetical protein
LLTDHDMTRRSLHRLLRSCVVIPLVSVVVACGGDGPTGPTSTTPLPFVRETATMRVYHEPGDTVDTEWQETYNTWALGRLGVQPPSKIEYRKYFSRDAMGRFTGNYSTNGYAEPDRWRFHTIWPRDNHEIIHVYTAIVGRPSDFFNEGIAVAFQTDPATGEFSARFNGQEVHSACRGYLAANQLPLPVANYVTTTAFRGLQDQVLSYRYAGSVVRFLVDRHGIPTVLEFFRQSGGREESLATIRGRVQTVLGTTIEEVERDWLAFLRSS